MTIHRMLAASTHQLWTITASASQPRPVPASTPRLMPLTPSLVPVRCTRRSAGTDRMSSTAIKTSPARAADASADNWLLQVPLALAQLHHHNRAGRDACDPPRL